MLDFIKHSFALCFLAYLIKDAEIFSDIREKVKIFLNKKKVNGHVKFANKGLYWLGCHICISLFLSLLGVILGVLPEWSFIYYPISVAILYKHIK